MHLPDELLRQIFQPTDSHDIVQKFLLSQVCSQWRKTALSQRALWNRIAIMTPRDAKRLPVVLERSGSADLDVQLLFQHRYLELMLDRPARMTIASTLARCHSRLQHLFVDISRKGEEAPALTSLLGVGLSFPILEDLEIKNTEYHDKECDLSFFAPRLHRLKLRQQGALSWRRLLVPSLTHLSLRKCHKAELHLLNILLRQCPELRSLTFHVSYGATEFHGLKTSAARLVPHLKALDLSTDSLGLTRTLRTGFRDLCVDEMTTETMNGFIDEEMKELLIEILYGMDPLLSLHMVDNQIIVLQDSHGRSRRMEVWNEDGQWERPSIWHELATRHNARESMKKFWIRSFDWNVLAQAFSVLPPEAMGIELHIDLVGDAIDDPSDFEYDDIPVPECAKSEPGLWFLRCPTLSKILFTEHKDYRGNSGGPRTDVVRRLLSAVVCSAVKVEVMSLRSWP